MTPRRDYGWAWFFVVLVAMSVAGMVLPVVYNLGQQLTAEQLEQARLRWRERGPADYDLTFSVQHDRDPVRERHVVLVRDRRVVFAACEGEVLYASPALGGAVGLPFGATVEEPPWSVDRVFDRAAALLAEQEATAGKNFLVVAFDPKEGYPRRLVRRVARTSTREEWLLKLWLPGELEQEAARYR